MDKEKKEQEKLEKQARKDQEKQEKKAQKEKAKKEKRVVSRTKGFLKGLIIGVLIGAILMGYWCFSSKLNFNKKLKNFKEGFQLIFGGKISYDFQEAVLGEAIMHKDFIVMEEDVSVTNNITKSGLGNFAIFSKTKEVVFAGKGIFTVDFGRIKESSVTVDDETKTVKVIIPHAVLHETVVDPEKTKIEDTEKGFLAIGDIKMTEEEHNNIEKEAKALMKEKLETSEVLAKADEYAIKACEELFKPLVKGVSADYSVEVAFE